MSKYAIFIADAHIKPRTWTNWTDLHGDAYAALRGLGEYTKKNNIDIMMSGGDLLDSNRPCSEDLLELRTFLEAFKTSYIIRGNHDKVQPAFPIVLLPAVTELTPDSQVAFNHVNTEDRLSSSLLSGISYAETRQELLNSLHAVKETWDRSGVPSDAPHILMLHCTMKHLSGPGMKFALDENDIAGIFKGYRLLVLVGDVHVRDTRTLPGTKITIHSPGALYPQSADKVDTPCYATLVDMETGELSPIDCNVREYSMVRWSDVKATLPEHVSALRDNRKSGYLPPAMLIKTGPLDRPDMSGLDLSDIVVRFISESDGNLMDPVEDPNVPVYRLEDAVAAEAPTETTKDLALRLLSSDDPKAEVDNWLNFWKVERVFI